MKHITKQISILLLLVSSFFVIPKEVLHELSFHDDTVDHCVNNSTSGLTLSNEHHHCEILQVFVPPYHASYGSFHFSQSHELISHYTFNTTLFSFEIANAFVIRGPPAGISYC